MCLSRDLKLYHYATVVKPKILYGSETLLLSGSEPETKQKLIKC